MSSHAMRPPIPIWTYALLWAAIIACLLAAGWWSERQNRACIAVVVCATKDGRVRQYPDPCVAKADGATVLDTDLC